jgi:muramoyltetrapeptide carboxypeptidase
MIPSIIPYLKKGDLIYITAPAKAVEQNYIDSAVAFLEKEGYKVLVSKHCAGRHHYFSGTDAERAEDFQVGIDHPEVKAILCARGGYGSVRILDHIQWASQLKNPKWIIGFSDITYFHQKMQKFGLPSLHATMPLNFETNTKEALSTFIQALESPIYEIKAPFNQTNKIGIAEGQLVGGNLSILYGLLGTDDHIDFKGKLLFIEDLGEHLYQIDRMLYAFRKAGIFEKINGLLVGGMTNLEDTDVPFGKSINEIILAHFTYRSIPIAFDIPSGHINDNRALRMGANIRFEVNTNETKISFTE